MLSMRRLPRAAGKRRTSGAGRGQRMEHFYWNVLRLGNVAVSRHAQERILSENIPIAAFEHALLWPSQPDVHDGQDVLWREHNGLRLVILLNPTPNRGAVLVKTVYRVNLQANARPR